MNRKYVLPAFVVALLFAATAQAQTLAWIDFETSVPDELPIGPDNYILVNIGDPPIGTLIRTAQDGAMFDDPIGPDGNKSAVWDNNDHIVGTPDGPTNATMGFGPSVWDADPTQFTSGSIEYDIYLDPVPDGGVWTFMENRGGFVNQDGFISTVNDTTFRFSFRATADASLVVADSFGFVGSVAPLVGETNHVQINILPNKTHTIKLNGALVEWDTPGGTISALPWVDPAATGVSEMSFVTDFQGEPADPHGLVWIDNIHVTVPEPGTLTLVMLGAALLLAGYRRQAA